MYQANELFIEWVLKRMGSPWTYLKKSSLQNSEPFRAKHFSFNCTWHSLHCKHFACHVRSNTFNINRSKMSSWHPPHLGIVATKKNNWIVTLRFNTDRCGRNIEENLNVEASTFIRFHVWLFSEQDRWHSCTFYFCFDA